MAIRKHKIIPYLVLSALTAMAEPIAARPISIDPGATIDVYLDYNSRGTISAPLTIYKSQAFQHQALIEYVLLGTYFGIFVALFLFNISLYFTDKERGFLYYSLYILAIMTYYVIATGLLSHIGSIGQGFWMNEFMLMVANAAGIIILLFVRKFFSTRAQDYQSSILEHIRQARPADDHADDITFLQIVL